jgi:hypothetical protein
MKNMSESHLAVSQSKVHVKLAREISMVIDCNVVQKMQQDMFRKFPTRSDLKWWRYTPKSFGSSVQCTVSSTTV